LIAGGALLWRDGGALVFSASAAEGQLHGAAIIGVALALAALALMAGAAPLHVWSAPASVRGEPLMAAALGSAGAAALTFAAIRAAAHTFTTPALAEAVAPALLAMGAVGAIYAAVQALGASDLRRIAAYLGAAQLSCVIMAVATGSASGYAAALIQTAAFTASALGLLVASPSPARFVDIDGLARRAPLSSFALTVATLNLMGAPLTLGFLARWRMIETYIGGGSWWIVGAIVAVWLVALVAGARVIERVYFRRASVAVEFTHNPWRVCAAPSLLFAVLLSLSGAHPAFVLRLADAAAGAAALARGP
jgi:formate hydrogenlyase subunit 3/multisubunit Na+/H+ antiporter MnhD subunit